MEISAKVLNWNNKKVDPGLADEHIWVCAQLFLPLGQWTPHEIPPVADLLFWETDVRRADIWDLLGRMPVEDQGLRKQVKTLKLQCMSAIGSLRDEGLERKNFRLQKSPKIVQPDKWGAPMQILPAEKSCTFEKWQDIIAMLCSVIGCAVLENCMVSKI